VCTVHCTRRVVEIPRRKETGRHFHSNQKARLWSTHSKCFCKWVKKRNSRIFRGERNDICWFF
jgi:hypothetical protein